MNLCLDDQSSITAWTIELIFDVIRIIAGRFVDRIFMHSGPIWRTLLLCSSQSDSFAPNELLQFITPAGQIRREECKMILSAKKLLTQMYLLLKYFLRRGHSIVIWDVYAVSRIGWLFVQRQFLSLLKIMCQCFQHDSLLKSFSSSISITSCFLS